MQIDHKQIPNYDMGYRQVCSITEEFLHSTTYSTAFS